MSCSLYFGMPGSGKTTYATKFAIDIQNKINNHQTSYQFVFTNFAVNYPGVMKLDVDYMRTCKIEYAALIIDEATLYFDSRDSKKFDNAIETFIFMHRHMHSDIYYYVQIANSLDLRIRQITDRVYWVHKGAIRRWYTWVNLIDFNINIPGHKEPYGDILEGYRQKSKLAKLLDIRFSRKKYYQYFDSFELGPLAARPEAPHVPYVRLPVLPAFPAPFDGFLISPPHQSEPEGEAAESGCA